MEAQIKGLQQEMAALKEDTERIRSDLKTERAEKGELVAAVDEWLAMQQAQPAPSQARSREASVSAHHDQLEDQRQPSREVTPDEFNRSVSRSVSGSIRPPATAEKKIPRFGAPGGHSRGNSGGKSGIAMPTPGRGIMGSIERMGRGGA
jgi:chromosome segregation ATPase